MKPKTDMREFLSSSRAHTALCVLHADSHVPRVSTPCFQHIPVDRLSGESQEKRQFNVS